MLQALLLSAVYLQHGRSTRITDIQLPYNNGNVYRLYTVFHHHEGLSIDRGSALVG